MEDCRKCIDRRRNKTIEIKVNRWFDFRKMW